MEVKKSHMEDEIDPPPHIAAPAEQSAVKQDGQADELKGESRKIHSQ